MKIEVFNQYLDGIIKLYDIPREWIFSKLKKREVVDARHMLYYLCFNRNIQVSYIQRFMRSKGYDIGHSSIIHGIKVIEEKVLTDSDYKQIINKIK